MAFNGLAFGLPFTMNSVEGTEAALFVAAAASRSTWRKATIALGAAVVTLIPFAVVLWAAFHFVGPEYLDYTIAFLIFALGLREIREGLSERPRKGGPTDPGQVEQIGLGPASAGSIRDFQRRHRLEPTGEITARVRAALRAARAEAGYEAVDPYVFGVDAADAEAVRAFQRRHGLPVSGNVDAPTRGALRVAQQQGLLDGDDSDAVRRFQADHGLAVTGAVDERTAVALETLRGEGATTVGTDEKDRPVRTDPVAAFRDLDPADAESVRRFQRSLGMPADGTVTAETQGALLAMRARLDGAVTKDGAGLLPDPADADNVRRFQRLYGLPDDGTIGTSTRQAIRYVREYLCDVDAASADSIRRFQRAHGLTADGVIGPQTQAALAALRAERYPDRQKARSKRYGDVVAGDGAGPRVELDIADPDAVRDFQRRHHLVADGVIGPHTQEAVRLARQQRLDHGPRLGSHDLEAGPGGPLGTVRTAMGDAWPAYVGVMLESSEALLYSFAVTSSSFAFLPAVLGAGIGFSWPWTVLPLVRKATQRLPEWKQETGIGTILVGVAAAFGLLHMMGVFG